MKNKLLLIIFILSFVASLVLSFPNSGLNGFCEIGSELGCNSVQNSKYAYFFGFNNSYLGLFAFALLSIMIYSHIKYPNKYKRLIVELGIIVGALIALYFLYLQIFILKSFCKYCLVVDVGMIMALGLIIPWKTFK